MTDDHDDPIAAAFRRLAVPDRPPDALILARLAAEARRSPAPPHPIRRFLMRPTVRYSSAAALILLAAGFLSLTPRPSMALEEVIKATEKHGLVRFKMTQTSDDRETGLTGSLVSTVYVDLRHSRLRQEVAHLTLNGAVAFTYAAVYDYEADRCLFCTTNRIIKEEAQAKDEMDAWMIRNAKERGLTDQKKAIVSRVAQTQTDDIKPMSDLGKGRTLLDSLRKLQANPATTSFRGNLDGREATKYRLVEGNLTSVLWVDDATKLPIRIEFTSVDPSPRIARNEWVYTDFAWDPAGADPAVLFGTLPPAGFEVKDTTNEP
ncbi:hypothetical protein TA3x_002345 [Tundrisphaera sp. TA3]|uniref:hypothetical protein n=1 Tax=Tundrisphaera sp. TA3 TaxID=3435775 RepID=UPI003EBF8C4D